MPNEKQDEEELILRNTFLNAQRQNPDNSSEQKVNNEPKVKWMDEISKTPLISIIPRTKMKHPKSKAKSSKATVKPIIKRGDNKSVTPQTRSKGDASLSASDFLDELYQLSPSPVKKDGPKKAKGEFSKDFNIEQSTNGSSSSTTSSPIQQNEKVITTLGIIRPIYSAATTTGTMSTAVISKEARATVADSKEGCSPLVKVTTLET